MTFAGPEVRPPRADRAHLGVDQLADQLAQKHAGG
jgi:hypothetical protein